MISSYDPYQAPGTAYAPMAQPTGNEPITPAMIESLRGAKPWIRLLSILGFIGAGLMILSGLSILVLGAALPIRKTAGAEFTPLLGLVYFPLAFVYLLPAIFMHRYASAIDRLLMGVSARALEEALEHNQSFWKVAGILALSLLGLGVLVFVGAIVAGVLAAASR